MPGIPELLTRQFYDWERLGRGWDIWPGPVELEPPFRPFEGHRLPPDLFADDGRFETPSSRFGEKLLRFLGVKSNPPLPPEIEGPDETEPGPLGERSNLITLQLSLSPRETAAQKVFEQCLASLRYRRGPMAFELVGNANSIQTQVVVSEGDEDHVEAQLRAHFPALHIGRTSDALLQENLSLPLETVVVEFGLGREFMLPLRTERELSLDPFVGILGALESLRENELGLYQVLFQSVRNPWPPSILRAVTDNQGGPFFADAPELLGRAREKIERPLYAVVLRVMTRGEDFGRCWEIARNLAEALCVYSDERGNELVPLSNDGYEWTAHVEDAILRRSRRSGMLLNSRELTGFAHLPSSDVSSPKLLRPRFRSRSAPAFVRNAQGMRLGTNPHGGNAPTIALSKEQRVRHMHLVGASGTGKSTLLFNMVRQDIENGEGVGILDPHGDLVDNIMGIIPENRIDDVVLLDPADEEHPVGLNILSAHTSLEKTLLASDLVSVFERLSTSWGDQMGSVLSHAILAFLESRTGGTLADLRRFMLEPAFRNQFLETVDDPEVLYYWKKGFPQLTGNRSVGPVLTRLESFLSPKPIRYMVSQKENRLDFGEIMDQGKIFLAKLSQGAIGKENSFLLGSLLVSKFQQTAVGRQSQAEAQRRYFWLYIDEFHNFITPSMAEILSGARKYRLGLILAHQELRQLERDREVASAVLSNCYTRVVFRVGDDDARKLSEGFSFFEARDLQDLHTGQAICRIERSSQDFNLSVPLPEPPDPVEADERRRKIITASREKYGTARANVEAGLEKRTITGGTEALRKDAPVEIRKVSVPAERFVPDEGRTLHESLKDRFILEGEKLFYTVTREHPVLDGAGRIDLVFVRGKRRIACEIAITTKAEWETGNVRKCLEAGFETVVVVAPDEKRLEQLRNAACSDLDRNDLRRVEWLLPERFREKLESWARADPEGAEAEKQKPRRRKLELHHPNLSNTDRVQLEGRMLSEIANAMKRKS